MTGFISNVVFAPYVCEECGAFEASWWYRLQMFICFDCYCDIRFDDLLHND